MIRIIGDVHGLMSQYLDLISPVEYSVQLGDMGLDYSEIAHLGKSHVFIPGNHDNYNHLPDFSLRDFGEYRLGGIEFFYIRGAYSIDQNLRTEGVDWWRNEELSYGLACVCYDQYVVAKPKIILSHDCPTRVLPYVAHNSALLFRSTTNQLMEACFEVWEPDLWIFGHHHRTMVQKIGKTIFLCLDELHYIDFDGNPGNWRI